MSNYIEFTFTTDPSELWQNAVDYIKDRIPGWEPPEGSFININLESVSNMAAEVRDIGAVMPKAAFRAFGAKIVDVPPIDATAATVDTTWTMKDTVGYTIIAGTLVAIPVDGSNNAAFEVIDDVVIPPGNLATATGEVQLQAILEGAFATGLGTAGQEIKLIDSLAFVDSVVMEGATSGGTNSEDDDAYVDRLSEELKLLTPRPILPIDFEILSRQVAGVYRAVALDGYNPDDETYDNERMITLAVIDTDGNNLSTPEKDAVQANLQAQRELNFIVNIIDATHTGIDVTWEAVALPGWDTADVLSRGNEALTGYLDPVLWGAIPGTGDRPSWVNTPSVRLLELGTVLNNVQGLDYVTSLTFCIHGGSLASTDILLPGPVPLATTGDLNGTVDLP